MNEQLQEAVTTLINKTLEGAKGAANFLEAEIPDVVYQLLVWHGVSNFIYFLIALLMIPAWIQLEIRLCAAVLKVAKKTRDPDLFPCGYVLAFSAARLGALVLFVRWINIQWLQIWLAPKVWLIEYAAKLVGADNG